LNRRHLIGFLGAPLLGAVVCASACSNAAKARPNSPPVITTINAAPATAPFLASVALTGVAADPEDGNLSALIRWSSSRDGSLGTGAAVSRNNLSVGTHTISAAVTDSNGASATATTTVTITNAAPVVTAAAQPARLYVGGLVVLSGSAIDAEEGNLSASLKWTSSVSGVLGTGTPLQATLPVGLHTITAAVTDAAGATGSKSVSVQVDAVPTQPNILLILADDLGAEASALYPQFAGNAGQVATPNLQALASQGIVFDNVWVNPVCSPTRAQILTGLYGNRTGVTYVGDVLPTTFTSIFKYITASSPAAYGMGVFGKWHLGTTAQHVRSTGVPEFKGFLSGGVSDYFNWNMTDINGTVTNVTTYSTTAITDYAIEFINRQRQDHPSDPWFAYVPYNAPHGTGASTGFQVPPANLHSVNVGALQPGAVADTIPVYQAMVQALDTEIGRLLNAVGPVGSPERDNTIVIFLGDNGTPAAVKDPTAKIRGSKSSIFEGGVLVPMVMAGAGVTRHNDREGRLVVGADLYATIAALSGIQVNQIGDSTSIVPLLSNASAGPGRTTSFSEMCLGTQAYYAQRNDRYKLSYSNGIWGLYDLVSDPQEATNRYNDATLAAVRTALEAELAQVKQGATAGCFL